VSVRRAASASALALVIACGGGGRATPERAAAAPLSDSLRTAAHPAAAALSEEVVQGVVDAINAADARLAAPAVQKATSPDVKRFASRLASAHSQKVTDTPPPKNDADALVAPLRQMQTQSSARLAGLPAGAPFDRAFVESQVATHERALAMLDSIRPAAQVGDLPTLVASTRAQVVRHLDEARALQRRLGAP